MMRHELPSVTDEQLAHHPIEVLCCYSSILPLQKQRHLDTHDFKRIQLISQVACLVKDRCERDLRLDLMVGPLIKSGFLPEYFVLYDSKKGKKEKPELLSKKMLDLMQKIGVIKPESLIETDYESLGNKGVIALLTDEKLIDPRSHEKPFYRSQHPLHGKDSLHKNLVMYSRETKLVATRFEIGVSISEEQSPNLSIYFARICVSPFTYGADYGLSFKYS